MDNNYDADIELAGLFEKKHGAFLSELARMPMSWSERGEERAERLNFYKRYPMKDSFLMGAMKAYRKDAYRRFMKRMGLPDEQEENFGEEQDADIENSGREQDADIASAKHRNDIDNLIFMEAVNEAVATYTGVKKNGESYGFVAGLGQIYKQLAGKNTAKNDLDERGISDTEIPKKNLPGIMRVVRDVEKMLQREGKSNSPEEILSSIQDKLEDKFTKKERELIRTLVFDTGGSVPLYAGDQDEDDSLGFQPADTRNGIEAWEDREYARDMLRIFCENIEKNWALIDSAGGLRKKEIIQLFFSANMLEELKLDGNRKPYEAEPAGDEEFYLIVEPQGDFLYEKLLDERYLRRAFAEFPEDFYEVYVKLLRRDFGFSDVLIAELVGKNKSTVSRDRKKYVEIVKALCDFS